MQISDVPSRFPIPFAESAGAGYTRTIPEASQIGITNGAASLTDGFPPLCFLPVGSGGTPPWGQDFNGILKQITQWSQWQGAGGLVPYDSAFSTAIGGYPKGALLSSSTAGTVWLCTTDNNTTNPDSGGAGWLGVANIQGIQNGTWVYAVAGGTANALTVTLSPAPAALTAGMEINVLITSTNTAASPTLNGATIVRANGQTLGASELIAGSIPTFKWDGTKWRVSGNGQEAYQANTIIFNTTGTTSWVVPVGVTRVYVRMWGAGGGGGGSSTTTSAGSGGGGGGYAESSVTVTPGASIPVTVGAFGAAGAGTSGGFSDGGAGGSSSFGAFVTATGGGAGLGSNTGPQTGGAGAGGTATGTFSLSGQSGGFAIGLGASGLLGGSGGAASFSRGIPGPNLNAQGIAGQYPGGGGNGGAGINPGGSGANGLVVISY